MRTDRRLLLVMATVTLVWGLVDASLGLSVGIAHLAPFLLMLGPLLSGRYIGERRLARLAGSSRRPRRRVRRSPSPRRALIASMPRGGALLACSLAVRPPPVAAAQM